MPSGGAQPIGRRGRNRAIRATVTRRPPWKATSHGHGTLAPVGPGRLDHEGGGAGRAGAHRAVATSPAVGIFQPRPEIRPGSKVRSGDRLGHVDVLGVRQDVVSPVDGIVGATLVEPGDAVEYGQDLVRIEMIGAVASSAAEGPA